MNDFSFPNYESYFSTTSHQVSDVSPIIHNIDYDESPQTFHYLNNASCDIMPQTQPTSVDLRHQQDNLYGLSSNTLEEQMRDGHGTNSKSVSGGSLSNITHSGTAYGTIPFVQIHATNVQPQRTSYGNVFRRNISRQEEIKSEPIKSENSDAVKERANATPTPPRANNQTQNEVNVESLVSNEKQSGHIINNNSVEEKSDSLLQIYKCSKCPFLSLNQVERENHVVSQQCKQKQSINCPGCSNVFFNPKSLEEHLKLDHMMGENDILKLINTLTESILSVQGVENASSHPEPRAGKNVDVNEPIRKSRIYLKNVDCLREPNRQPIEQTDNQLAESHTFPSIEPKKTNSSKQKISIKSVDVLREPALLRRNYDIQSPDLNNFMNFNNDMLSNPLSLNTSNTYDYSTNLENAAGKTDLNGSDIGIENSSKSRDDPQQKPRPKIYVKSVESFNLMPINSLQLSNNNTYHVNQNSSNNTSQVYDSTVVHLPYMFDSNSKVTNLNNNTNFINNHNEMDTFQYISDTSSNNNYIVDSSLYSGNSAELGDNCEQIENITLIPDTETPTPPTTNDLIITMNKPLVTSQEQRGTLHLRTVDELNLMNKTEVQHLIAPNLDNNHCGEVLDKANSSSLNDINLIGDDLYEDDNFKFHDLDTQMVNDWPETYEDLAEDINCIIAHASNENSTENLPYAGGESNQKVNSSTFDIDTPQVSLITIRDIEELTGTANNVTIHSVSDHQQVSVVEQIQDCNNITPAEIDIGYQEPLIEPQAYEDSVSHKNLKRELSNATPESNDLSQVTKTTENNVTTEAANKKFSCPKELPPLVPVTNTAVVPESNLDTVRVTPTISSNIPLPPLVPVSPLVKLKNVTNKPIQQKGSPLEKGRIYVANNLMEPAKRPVAVSATSGTSVRGRPFGSNLTRISKLKIIGSSPEDLFSKCSVKGCAFRFKNPNTVEYHIKCHDATSDNPNTMLCPECTSKDFNNWNTLHTHLWRAHQIDMELYKCELCEFKTPIFSRLVNTHAKIHFDDRNYKCEQCEKAFKNSKQLKNHRRWHRVQAAATVSPILPKDTPTEIHRCLDCGSTFSLQKTLREHCCKKGDSSLKCSVCEKLMSSKSSLKLHILTHSDGEKRYKCQNCDYATNDHNAFRRHRMGHENRKMYDCSFCPYKSVQSVAYQKHILQKHPEMADLVIHKCSVCSFSTINRSLLIVHQAKHEKTTESDAIKVTKNDETSSKSIDKSLALNATELQKSKIKVKSNLFSTNIPDSPLNVNSELSLMQLYSAECGSIT